MPTRTVFDDIISKNGIENQMIVAIEEFSEIIKELTKRLREINGLPVKNLGDIKHEICDSYIVLEQIKNFFFENEEEFNERFEERIFNLILIVLDAKKNETLVECPYDKKGNYIGTTNDEKN